MRALRVASFLAWAAVPVAVVAAACSDPLSSLQGSGSGGDAGPPTADATLDTSPPPDDAPSAFVDAVLDAPLAYNAFDGADRPEGGLPVSDPGVITCGASTCNAFAGNQCCTGEEGGVCLSTSVACGGGGAMTCDEADDCLVGKVCCGTLSAPATDGGSPSLSSACATSCGAPPGIQLCRTNDECGEAGPCVVQACSDGLTYELCGLFAALDGGFGCTPQ